MLGFSLRRNIYLSCTENGKVRRDGKCIIYYFVLVLPHHIYIYIYDSACSFTTNVSCITNTFLKNDLWKRLRFLKNCRTFFLCAAFDEKFYWKLQLLCHINNIILWAAFIMHFMFYSFVNAFWYKSAVKQIFFSICVLIEIEFYVS